MSPGRLPYSLQPSYTAYLDALCRRNDMYTHRSRRAPVAASLGDFLRQLARDALQLVEDSSIFADRFWDGTQRDCKANSSVTWTLHSSPTDRASRAQYTARQLTALLSVTRCGPLQFWSSV